MNLSLLKVITDSQPFDVEKSRKEYLDSKQFKDIVKQNSEHAIFSRTNALKLDLDNNPNNIEKIKSLILENRNNVVIGSNKIKNFSVNKSLKSVIKDISKHRNPFEDPQYYNNYDSSSKLSFENVTTKQYTSEIPSNYDHVKENSYKKRAVSHSFNHDSSSHPQNNMLFGYQPSF